MSANMSAAAFEALGWRLSDGKQPGDRVAEVVRDARGYREVPGVVVARDRDMTGEKALVRYDHGGSAWVWTELLRRIAY